MYKILVIDDTKFFIKNISNILNKNGFETIATNSSIEGIKLAKEKKPDLIISDIIMPEKDGYEILKELKRDMNTATIPFIFVTSKSKFTDIRKGMELGADDYLIKPFSDEELISAINARIEKQLCINIKTNIESEELSNIKLSKLLSDSLAVIYSYTIDSQEIKLNFLSDNIKELTGYSVEEIKENKKLFFDIINPINYKLFKFNSTKAYHEQKITRDYCINNKDNVNICLLNKLKILKNKKEEFEIVGSITDITEQKQIESELSKTNNQLNHLLNSNSAVIYTYELEMDYFNNLNKIKKFHFVSSNIERIFGYNIDELFKNPNEYIMNKIHKDDFVNLKKVYPKLFENGYLSVEYRVLFKNNTYIWVHDEKELVYDEYSSRNIVIGSLVNITHIKEVEQEVILLNEELENRVLERTKQLQTVNSELEAFSYSVSHDLRGFIRSIKGFSHILYEDYCDIANCEGTKYLKKIDKTVLRMEDFLEGMLRLYRLSKKEVNRKKVNLSKIANKIIGALIDSDKDRKAKIQIEDNLFANSDIDMIKAVLENLFHNAWKYTKNEEITEISFKSKKIGDTTYYRIKDNGVGFDEKYIDKLFVAFERLHSSKEFEGTGIGLATVQRIIYHHGGKIWARSRIGEGASFYFTI